MKQTEPDKPEPNRVSLVSVAMATYNGEAFLREQLDSILGQDYPNLEIVICDDSSTDRTAAILEEYRGDSRIRIVRNLSNIGTTRNFEQALGLCRGDFIALADQDDIWQSDKVSQLLKTLRDTGAWMAFSDATLIDRNSEILAESFQKTSGIRQTAQSYKSFFLFNCVTGSTTLIDRRLLAYFLPFPEGLIVHDWWIAFVAARLGRLAYTDEKLVRYRVHGQNQIGVNRLSLVENLRELGGTLVSGKRLQMKCTQLRIWQRTYLNYFSCCQAFEQAHNLDTATTRRMIAWAKDIDHYGMAFRHATTFARNPELFCIIPQRLRPIVAVIRLISTRDLVVVVFAARIALATGLVLLLAAVASG